MKSLAILLPVVSWGLLFCALHARARLGARTSTRHCFLATTVAWSSLAILAGEALGAFGQFNYAGVVTFWLGVSAVAGVVWQRAAGSAVPFGPTSRYLRGMPAAVASACGIAALTGLIAAIAPPNTFDSMTYHMARVAHWIQNAHLGFYPTPILRQLYMPPAAEVFIGHLQLLWGGDRWANMVQWGSFVGCMVAASALAAQLGGGRRAQALAVLLVATIPMAILQSSSTQNDMVCALWLLCFAYSIGEWRRRADADTAIFAGLALGLASMTKLTAYFFALPWLVVAVSTVTKSPLGRRELAMLIAIAVAFNSGHALRIGHAVYTATTSTEDVVVGEAPADSEVAQVGSSDPLDKTVAIGSRLAFVNTAFTLATPISNIVRNVGLHVRTPVTFLNEFSSGAIELIHRAIGLDSSDPRTTYPPGQAFAIDGFNVHEDGAGNPLHLLLIAVAVALASWRRDPATKMSRRFLLMIGAAFLVFCTVLRWQPWHSRLQLPLFVLASAPVAVILAKSLGPRVLSILVGVLSVCSLPAVLLGDSRPLVGPRSILVSSRVQQYFVARPDLEIPYRGAVDHVGEGECSEIGLLMGVNDWEYPIWALLGGARSSPISLRHIDVGNGSRLSSFPDPFAPCAILATTTAAAPTYRYGGHDYRLGWAAAPLSVYLR